MRFSKRNLIVREKNCCIQEVIDINSDIVCLYKNIVNRSEQSIIFNWSTLNSRVRNLIKRFYYHCLEYVNLTQFEQLFDYGKNYCFENCILKTLLSFQELFPTFPTRFEWRQSNEIRIIINILVSTYFDNTN